MNKVRIISEQDYPKWDKYLQDRPTENFFYRIGWLKVVQRTYGHRPLYLMATFENEVCGILPVFLVSVPMFGRYLASDAFTSYGGVYADDEEIELSLMEKGAGLASSYKGSYLEIKNTKSISSLSKPWCRKSDYCTMIVDLGVGANKIWKGWHPETRRNVRKATKAGLHVEQGSHLLDDFYRLVTLTMRRHGTPVHSKKFYQNILQEFPDDVTIYVVKLFEQPVATSLTVSFKTCIHSFVGASDAEFFKLKPNDLLYWEIIQHASNQGFRYLDFGRSSWESGTFRYKMHMGAKPQPLYYDYYLNRRKTVPHIHQDNKRYRLATEIWQRLPLGITRVLGPHLIKYVV